MMEVMKYAGVEFDIRSGWRVNVGKHSNDDEDQGSCQSCIHISDSSSDIFGECLTCLVHSDMEDWMYNNEDGRCPSWEKCPEEVEHMTEGMYPMVIDLYHNLIINKENK